MHRTALAITLLAGLVLPGERGRAQNVPALAHTLDGLVTTAALGDHVSVSVVDLRNGQSVYGHAPDLALNPASNMKLVTAATALVELGADFRMLTGLYGHVEGDGVAGGLHLRGYGDPTLRIADLVDLCASLADRGVRRVDEVVVDGSYFDDQFLPPAFDQQPGEVAPFRAAVSAVSVDENAYELRVLPGPAADAAAVVRLAASGYFVVDNGMTTSAAGAPNVIADQHAQGDQLSLRLRGTVPLGILGVGYRRRVEQPLPYAGHALVEALRRTGIHVPDRVTFGPTPSDAPLIVQRRSPPLSTILLALGKDSDNFVAETVLKVVGAERHRPGRTSDGTARSLALLEQAGVPHGAATVINGSGLFTGNLVAASHFTRLLTFVYRNPAIRAEYLAQLATAGVDGTLEGRLADVPRGSVRAKTGTLDDAIALSGYVIGPNGDAIYAFSVLTNGIAGKHGAARGLCDDVARTLVRNVWPAH